RNGTRAKAKPRLSAGGLFRKAAAVPEEPTDQRGREEREARADVGGGARAAAVRTRGRKRGRRRTRPTTCSELSPDPLPGLCGIARASAGGPADRDRPAGRGSVRLL